MLTNELKVGACKPGKPHEQARDLHVAAGLYHDNWGVLVSMQHPLTD